MGFVFKPQRCYGFPGRHGLARWSTLIGGSDRVACCNCVGSGCISWPGRLFYLFVSFIAIASRHKHVSLRYISNPSSGHTRPETSHHLLLLQIINPLSMSFTVELSHNRSGRAFIPLSKSKSRNSSSSNHPKLLWQARSQLYKSGNSSRSQP